MLKKKENGIAISWTFDQRNNMYHVSRKKKTVRGTFSSVIKVIIHE